MEIKVTDIISSVEESVDHAIAAVGHNIVLGAPLGLGKPVQVMNAFFQRALIDPEINLHIYTALSLELPSNLKLPSDLASRKLPAQSAGVDGAALLRSAQLPTRKDRVWEIELAPLTRMDAWKVPEIKVGDTVGVLGFTFTGEKGDAVLRAEYLFIGGQVYGLRSSPA